MDELEEVDESKFYVDVPNSNVLYDNEVEEVAWINLQTFDTREEALKFASSHFGADEDGRIQIVTGG